MSYVSGDGCINCAIRHEKCDKFHPACGRCTLAGINCEGYPAGNIFQNSQTSPHATWKFSSDPALSISAIPESSIQVIDLTPSTTNDSMDLSHSQTDHLEIPNRLSPPLSPSNFLRFGIPGSCVAPPVANHMSRLPFSSDWTDIDSLLTGLSATESGQLDSESSQMDKSYRVSSRRLATREPLTPHATPDTANLSLTPFSVPVQSHQQALNCMTPGQASLLDALFSLAQPEVRPLDLSLPTPWTPPHSSQSPTISAIGNVNCLPVNDSSIDDPNDPEDVKGVMLNALALGRSVKSNSMPYILQCYALWMNRFLFEPLRVVQLAKSYITSRCEASEEARWRMTYISDVFWAVTRSTAHAFDSRPELAVLVARMNHDFTLASSCQEPSRKLDMETARRTLDHSYEIISLMCKLSPLASVLATMQAAAPLFRRACPDSPEELVHLPSLLSTHNISLQYYATLDILLSAMTNRPMFFQYNVTFTTEVDQSLFSLQDGPGLRWLYGVPDRLVVTLARMNTLFEAFGSGVDSEILKELEEDIGSFEPVVSASVDPALTIRRLVVQECWRQAGFIYLYMGLCGADSQDARVVRAQERFMKLFKGTKPSRFPDSFLVFPMTILGIATSNPEEQDIIRKRMLSLPECSRRGTLGNEVVQISDVIWSRTSAVGQPAMWSDLRLACLWVTGM